MKIFARVFPIILLATGFSTMAQLTTAGDVSRSVRIIGEPSEQPSQETPAASGAKTAPSVVLPDTQNQNSSAIALEVLPKPEFEIGNGISLRVTVKKPGYLVLVDVDATGKLSQIYPNMITLSDPAGVNEKMNFLKSGQSLTLPEDGAAYKFIASAPTGVGMIVAILSETPVQVIDLPDVPSALVGQWRASEFIQETTRVLEILPPEGERRAAPPKWKFTTAFYAIK